MVHFIIWARASKLVQITLVLTALVYTCSAVWLRKVLGNSTSKMYAVYSPFHTNRVLKVCLTDNVLKLKYFATDQRIQEAVGWQLMPFFGITMLGSRYRGNGATFCPSKWYVIKFYTETVSPPKLYKVIFYFKTYSNTLCLLWMLYKITNKNSKSLVQLKYVLGSCVFYSKIINVKC